MFLQTRQYPHPQRLLYPQVSSEQQTRVPMCTFPRDYRDMGPNISQNLVMKAWYRHAVHAGRNISTRRRAMKLKTYVRICIARQDELKPFHRVSKIIIYPYLYRRKLATRGCCLLLSLRFRRCSYCEYLNLCKEYQECCHVLSRTTLDFPLLAHLTRTCRGIGIASSPSSLSAEAE